MKISIALLTLVVAFLLSSCNKHCEECGVYFLDGESSNDIIRLNNDGSFDFKDRGDSYVLGGTWELKNTSLTMVCDKSFENGRTFDATLINDTLYLDESNIFVRTSEKESAYSRKKDDEASHEENTEQTETSVEESINCFFSSKDFQDEEYSEVYITVNGIEHKLEEVNGMGMGTVEKSEFSDYSIPSNALHGMENFWAGLHTVFYAVERNASIVVMRGYLDEGGDGDISFEEIAKF